MEEEKQTENKEIKNKEYVLVEIPTEHRLAIQTPKGELMEINQAIVLILNTVEDLRQNLGSN